MSVTNANNIRQVVAAQLADPDSHWGVGTFGAIAEFVRDRGEDAALDISGDILSAVTARGAIRIRVPDGAQLLAFETAGGATWNQNMALCLPDDAAAMNRRAVLTEFGRDRDAVRPEDRRHILFDLGLSIPHVDACVRADATLAERLRPFLGKPVFDHDSGAMPAIFAAQPHRIFISRCGRVEVFQPIPPHDGKSPEGPHTHVLPKLLAHGRTHAATEPIPEGLVPCLSLYPAHPLKDTLGRVKPFEPARHDAFQELLGAYGDPGMIALKQRTIKALSSGAPPAAINGEDRFAKACIRVALRQAQARGVASASLPLWLAKYERPGPQDADDLSGCHS